MARMAKSRSSVSSSSRGLKVSASRKSRTPPRPRPSASCARSSASSGRVEPPLGLRARLVEPPHRLGDQPLGALGGDGVERLGDALADLLPACMSRRWASSVASSPRLGRELLELGHRVAQEVLLLPQLVATRLGLGQRLRASRRPAQAPRTASSSGGVRRSRRAACRCTRGFRRPLSSCWPCSSTSVSGERPQRLARGAAVVDPGGLAARRCSSRGAGLSSPGSSSSGSMPGLGRGSHVRGGRRQARRRP
jgi:hypothetical protein